MPNEGRGLCMFKKNRNSIVDSKTLKGKQMDTTEMLALYDRYERREADYPQYRKEVSGDLIRMISLRDDGHSMVIHSRLTEADADTMIETELAHFKGLGREFEWKLYSHDRPADLKARLAAHGFTIGEDEAIVALDLGKLPAELAARHSHDLRKVVDERGIADFAAVNVQAWSDEDDTYGIAATLRETPDRMSAWVAYVEGIPVCAARIDFPISSPFASLWGGATLEPFRNRGIYTAILSVRAQEAISRGYRFPHRRREPDEQAHLDQAQLPSPGDL